MLYTVPHYYHKFRCIAGECQDTCCAGWSIMIDDRSLQKYRNMKGSFGSRMHNSINWEDHSFKQYGRRCAFLNEEHLCDIYIEAGSDMLCGTCRNYPRHMEEFEGHREMSLSLSCIEAAKLILGCQEPVRFRRKEKEGNEEYENFNHLLFTKLSDTRDFMIETMQNRQIEISIRIGMCLALAHDIQTRVSKNQIVDIDRVLKRCKRNEAAIYCEKKLEHRKGHPERRFTYMKSMIEALSKLTCLNKEWLGYVGGLTSVLYGKGLEEYLIISREFTEYCHNARGENNHSWNIWTEQLMVYFIFTYFCGAVYDKQVLAKLKLAAASTLIIGELAKAVWSIQGNQLELLDMVKIAHGFSREIEHSEDNLNRIESMLIEHEAYGFEHMLDVTCGI